MTEFTPVAKKTALADPGSMLVEVGGRLVVLLHVDGQFYALDDVCTHDGGPLSSGTICDGAIVCPRHGAKFDVRTGAAITMPATQPTTAHTVRLEGDDILVKLAEP